MTDILIISCIILLSVVLTLLIMFWFEGTPIAKGKLWWLRLPIINVFTFFMINVLMLIEETYLTFHPEHRTKWVKTSIKQVYFE